ncbi:MAG: hypothetical protein ACI9KK_001048 [Ascidiaceihabitans sp.]|jgi:hypothetical protein
MMTFRANLRNVFILWACLALPSPIFAGDTGIDVGGWKMSCITDQVCERGKGCHTTLPSSVEVEMKKGLIFAKDGLNYEFRVLDNIVHSSFSEPQTSVSSNYGWGLLYAKSELDYWNKAPVKYRHEGIWFGGRNNDDTGRLFYVKQDIDKTAKWDDRIKRRVTSFNCKVS